MKKITLSLILVILLAAPTVTLFAVTAPSTDKVIPEDSDPWKVFEKIAGWFFAVFIVIAGIVFILAAFTFLFAAGDPEKVATARQYVLYAIVGVLVAFLSKGLINFAQMVAGTK